MAMAQSKRDIKAAGTGRAQAKVAGDDEMLRTGFVDGTPLEGGRIADDSRPVDLFAPARRIADADDSQQQQQQQDGAGTTTKNIAADSSELANPSATPPEQPGRRQGSAEPPAGGRRPAY